MNFALMAGKLERWFRANERDLPWRRPAPDSSTRAYRALVAEFMLQQTQVSRVIERYTRFLQQYPTVASLAAACEQDILTLWQGLGYYSRARNLLACARVLMSDFDGVIPETPDALLTLPGVGRYTAGAISSIAYGRPEPIVDGNVARVLARVLRIEEPITTTPARNRLWAAAEQLVVKADSPADLNQGLMELGSLVCTPSSPRCDACPIKRHCRARATGCVADIPVTAANSQAGTHEINVTSLVLLRPVPRAPGSSRVFLRQRPTDAGLWAGLWEPPAIEDTDLSDGEPTHMRRHMQRRHGLEVATMRQVRTCTRKLSHRTVQFTVMLGQNIRGRARNGIWVAEGQQLERIPMSNAHRRVITIGLNAGLSKSETCPISAAK